jgi:hypothetical protein
MSPNALFRHPYPVVRSASFLSRFYLSAIRFIQVSVFETRDDSVKNRLRSEIKHGKAAARWRGFGKGFGDVFPETAPAAVSRNGACRCPPQARPPAAGQMRRVRVNLTLTNKQRMKRSRLLLKLLLPVCLPRLLGIPRSSLYGEMRRTGIFAQGRRLPC